MGGWLGDHAFRFVDVNRDALLSQIRVGTALQRAQFIDLVERSIAIWRSMTTDNSITRDVLLKRANRMRDAAASLLQELNNDGGDDLAGLNYEDAGQLTRLLGAVHVHAGGLAEDLKKGGRPPAKGRTLLKMLAHNYLAAFELEPSPAPTGHFFMIASQIKQLEGIELPVNSTTLEKILKPPK